MNRGRSTQLALLLGVIFITAMAWAGWDTLKRSGGMAPRGVGGMAFANSAPGASTQVVIEVLSVGAGGRLRGRLLEEEGGRYRPTLVPVAAQLTADSAVLMGSAADIEPRAVLQLTGRFDGGHSIDITRAVVLTGYVTVER
ncbi:MAG: hypothetical protein KGO22_22515 [Gammaproteobacteria bacterium]|nr:hypothetical protein [Gammaproteobacteria bacterium]